MIKLILYSIAFVYCFYVGFALSISVYRRWVANELNAWNDWAFLPLILVFALIDAVLNFTVMLALGAPPRGCYTISARLEWYRKHPNASDFEKAFANFVCEKLLNPIDPNPGGHC